MKWEELKEILEEEYPPEGSITGDVIGELIPCPENVSKILVTLDVTLDSIAEAKEKNAQVIIAHHPFWWGEKEEVFSKDKYIKNLYDLIINQGIGLYVIHTNADFANNSLAFMQALAIDLEGIDQNDQNLSVSGFLSEEISIKELSNILKEKLELQEVEFRSNIGPNETVRKITISTGTSGAYGINDDDHGALHIVGEVKHHEWVRANQNGVKVLELSHFSETIFKHMIKILLENSDIEVELSKEKNGYKII